MHIKLSFLCDAANIDQRGRLNALGIFSEINSFKFPAVHPKMTLVLGLHGRASEAGKHNFKAVIVNDDGKEIAPQLTGTIETPDAATNANILIDFVNTTFPAPGNYAIDFVIDNQLAVSEKIVLKQVQQQK